MSSINVGRFVALALALAATGFTPALAQDPDFMPEGGKSLFVGVFGPAPDVTTLDAIAGEPRSEDDWAAVMAERGSELSDKEASTLAAYLAVNMPVAREVLDAAVAAGDVSAALPPDGRELAWNGCQGCHSLFAGYLTQERDLTGWQNMFESPFHRELKMTAQERDEFSRYSTINMPMKFEDVPEELRF